MICGSLHVQEAKNSYTKQIKKALDSLRMMDLEALAPGRYEIDGENMFLQVSQSLTQLKKEKRPEVHRKYIDVQYIISGRENIGFCIDRSGLEVIEDLLDSKDVLFYKEDDYAKEVMLPMATGDYAIFFPGEVHRPGCELNGIVPVKKAVIKIKVDSL